MNQASLKYNSQVKLLLDVLPFIAKENIFALKGGTAINLFVRDLPRLSVDIDLAYIGYEPREQALKKIEAGLLRIKKELEHRLQKIKVISSHKEGLQIDMKLFVEQNHTQIKIEVNPVVRGTLFPIQIRSLTEKASLQYGVEVDAQVVGLGDLYGGKLVAALDRQHPRDLFDVKNRF